MITKIILTGSFSNYELHCNSSDGSIIVFNRKDSTTNAFAFYKSGRLRCYTNTHKTLRKWMERKSKSIIQKAEQLESTQADTFL